MTVQDQEREVSGHDGASPTLAERIGKTVGRNANARVVYGDPVERNGITVIPVAKVKYGFGGGGGRSDKEHGEGGGGGAGVNVIPIGYIEMKDGVSEFRPIRDSAGVTRVLLAGSVMAFFLLRRLIKRLGR